jgi:hypothetical protein
MEDVDREYYKGLIAELREAIVMADNRLEAAMLGDEDICRHCIELARSYLQEHLQHSWGGNDRCLI